MSGRFCARQKSRFLKTKGHPYLITHMNTAHSFFSDRSFRFSRTAAPTRPRKGYTLIEILIALLLFSFLLAGVFSFQIQTMLFGYSTEARNRINQDMRNLTQSLNDDARAANSFLIFAGTEEEFWESGDLALQAGQSGDLLLLIQYNRRAVPTAAGQSPIRHIVAYYRSIDNETLNTGPVFRAERTFDGLGSTDPLPVIIEGLFKDARSREMVEISRGLADGRLFHNFWNRSIMINAQLIHGIGTERGSSEGGRFRRVTETYNFTVSPRG